MEVFTRSPGSYKHTDFRRGYETTKGTLKLLARIVKERHTHPKIRDRAISLTAGIPSMDYDGETRAIWDFIVDNIRYVRDPVYAEYETDPVLLDMMIDAGTAAEDCESIALYAATLFASIGRESEFEIYGRDPHHPRRFSHCALRVKNPTTKQWTTFDPVGAWAYQDFDLGDSVGGSILAGPVEHWSLEGAKVDAIMGAVSDLLGDAMDDPEENLWADCYGDAYGVRESESDMFGDALDTTKSVTDPVSDVAMNLGPYGMIVGGLLKGGTAVAGAFRQSQRDVDAQRVASGDVHATPGGQPTNPFFNTAAQRKGLAGSGLRATDIINSLNQSSVPGGQTATTPVALWTEPNHPDIPAVGNPDNSSMGKGLLVAGGAFLLAKLLGVV